MTDNPCVFEQHHADRVFELATIGASKRDIAAEIGISGQELKTLYRDQLNKGAARGREGPLKTLHEIAVSGENPSLLTFFVKSQCGWRDTGAPQSVVKVFRTFVEYSVGPESAPQQEPSGERPLSS